MLLLCLSPTMTVMTNIQKPGPFFSHSPSHLLFLSFSRFLSLSLSLFHTLSLSHTLSHTVSLSHTLFHFLTLCLSCSCLLPPPPPFSSLNSPLQPLRQIHTGDLLDARHSHGRPGIPASKQNHSDPVVIKTSRQHNTNLF